jgi:hypothetical protein
MTERRSSSEGGETKAKQLESRHADSKNMTEARRMVNVSTRLHKDKRASHSGMEEPSDFVTSLLLSLHLP